MECALRAFVFFPINIWFYIHFMEFTSAASDRNHSAMLCACPLRILVRLKGRHEICSARCDISVLRGKAPFCALFSLHTSNPGIPREKLVHPPEGCSDQATPAATQQSKVARCPPHRESSGGWFDTHATSRRAHPTSRARVRGARRL